MKEVVQCIKRSFQSVIFILVLCEVSKGVPKIRKTTCQIAPTTNTCPENLHTILGFWQNGRPAKPPLEAMQISSTHKFKRAVIYF